MIDHNKITKKHLEALKKDIEKDMARKGLNNTKSAVNSLEVKGNALLGNDYIYFLDKGRRPGKFPPVNAMRDYVRSKLGINNESEIKSVAYLIGRKIKEQGTSIFKDKSKGIQLDDKINDMLNNLFDELQGEARAEVLTWL